MEKKKRDLKSTLEKVDEEVAEAFDGEQLVSAKAGVESMKEEHTKVIAAMQVSIEEIKELSKNVKKCMHKNDLIALNAQCCESSKRACDSAYKKLSVSFGSFKKRCSQEKRRKDLTGSEPVVQARQAHPVHAILSALKDQYPEDGKPSTSLFEAKAGLNAALVSYNRSADPVAELQKMAGFKKMQKDLTSHLKSHEGGTLAIIEPPKRAKTFKILKAALDPRHVHSDAHAEACRVAR